MRLLLHQYTLVGHFLFKKKHNTYRPNRDKKNPKKGQRRSYCGEISFTIRTNMIIWGKYIHIWEKLYHIGDIYCRIWNNYNLFGDKYRHIGDITIHV